MMYFIPLKMIIFFVKNPHNYVYELFLFYLNNQTAKYGGRKMKEIVIVGAGGFGKEIGFLVNQLSDYHLLGYVDDRKRKGEKVGHATVLGTIEWLAYYSKPVNVAIGVAAPEIKKRIYQKLQVNPYLKFPNLISPFALIDEEVQFGQGNIIMPFATLLTDIQIGDFNMVNLRTSIGHDTTIGSYNSLFPNVTVSGNTTINDQTSFGVSSTLIQNIMIGSHSTIGAGAVVIKDIPSHVTAVGCPAHIIKKRMEK